MTIRILQGDCRDVLKTLPDQSVQCVVTSPPYFGLRSYLPDDHADKLLEIGSEKSDADYIANLVSAFRAAWRVLRDDGVMFVNLGDIYADKNRLMIPARVALALQADGWYIRDEIIWHKPRPTPAPVKDRTVCAHEMIYMLSKGPIYFYDWAAIEQPSAYPGLVRKAGKAFRDLAKADPNAARKRPGVDREIVVRETRRARSVWSVSPSPYTEGHFATMPPDIAEICIKAGSRVGDTILDLFGGAATTGMVADRLQRGAVLIELVHESVEIARRRVTKDAGLLAQVEIA